MTLKDTDLLRESLKINKTVLIRANEELLKIVSFNGFVYGLREDNINPYTFNDLFECIYRLELNKDDSTLIKVIL